MSGFALTRGELEREHQLAAMLPGMEHYLPAYQAALAGRLDLGFANRPMPMPRELLQRRDLPLLAVVSDIIGEPAGPRAWRSAKALIRWAEIAILHADGAPVEHYAHAIELAKTHMRVLLIEAPRATVEGWSVALRRPGLSVEFMLG